MTCGRLPGGASLLVFFVLLIGQQATVSALEQGEVTGKILRSNDRFVRDYQVLDYKGEKDWEAWGRGLVSLGWVVVQSDSAETTNPVLLVIDTRTAIAGTGSDEVRFGDLHPGDRIRARYRTGWDALHALEVKKLEE